MAVRKDSIQISIDIEAQEGVKAYQKLLDETKQVNNEMRKLKRSGQENSEEFKKLQKRASQLNGELNKLGGAGANMGQLINRSKQLSREMRSLVPGTKRFIAATKELKDVNTRLKDIRDQTRGVGKGMQEITILGLKLPPVFQKMAGGINTVGTAMKGLIALEIIQFFVSIFRTVDETTQAFVKLRGEIQQTTGATGEQLDQYSTRISAISSTFKVGTDELLTAANSLTKQLTGDFSKSLELIEKGFLAGGNRSGEFLDQIKEYPAFFREARLTGEQMIGVITQSVNQGVFSDKGVDLIKEFNLRIREMPKATTDALQAIGLSSQRIRDEIDENGVGGAFLIVQERLSQLQQDSPEVGQALADIFGGPGEDAGIQFIQNLQLTDDSLQNLIQSGGEYTQQLQEQLAADQALAEAQNRVSKGFNDTSNSLRIYVTRIKTFLFETAGLVLEFFEKLPATAQGVRASFVQVGENIKGFFERLYITMKITTTRIRKLNPFGKTNEQLDEEIAKLKQKRSQIKEGAESVMDAYKEAYLDGMKDIERRKAISEALLPPPAPGVIKKRAEQTVAAYQKATKEAAKKQKTIAPLQALGATSTPTSVSSSGEAEINTSNQEELLKNRFLQALITEQQYEDQRFQLQQEAYNKRLEFLQEKFGEESAQFIALENQKLQAQKDYEAQRAESTRKTEEARQQMTQAGFNAFGEFISGTIELLQSEEGERKKNAGAIKAFSIGKVIVDTQEAIMAIIKNAQANPGNILFPGLGSIIQGFKIAGVVAKSAASISKIRSTGFYEGGMTGNTPLFKDNKGLDVVGAVHKNEWVAPAWQVQHPVYGQMINWLETMRQQGFNDGGFASANIVPQSPTAPTQTSGNDAFQKAVEKMVMSQREATEAIKQKQFSVPTGQVADALDEEYRLRSKSSF